MVVSMNGSRITLERARILSSLRKLLHSDADSRMRWVRENLRFLMAETASDPVAIAALTGISTGTVRGFLRGTDSSIRNVILMALALGVELDQLAQPPEDFQRQQAARTAQPRGIAESR